MFHYVKVADILEVHGAVGLVVVLRVFTIADTQKESISKKKKNTILANTIAMKIEKPKEAE